MDMDHGGMGGPPMSDTAAGSEAPPTTMMMTHMTFFWGKNAEILFSGWPGSRTGMYALALIFVFALGLLVEWLSHSRFMNPNSDSTAAGLVQTVVHSVRVGMSYLVMLAVMSFNGGVFLAAIGGHTVGFFLFGSRVFKKSHQFDAASKTNSDDHIPLHH
ncbi:Copper transporter 6 [Linum perenne]